jgi:ABC-type dipeptide/oligopeptide/nickel transport system ATPase component
MSRCGRACSICLRSCNRTWASPNLFIAHDLAIVERMSHDVLGMPADEAVEYRPAAELFAGPEQEYTRTLLAAVPPARPRASDPM